MEPFPPPDSIGRDGLFLYLFSGLCLRPPLLLTWWDEDEQVARVRPDAGRGQTVARRARFEDRGRAGSGPRWRAARSRRRRLDAGGQGLRHGGSARVSVALAGRGPGFRGGAGGPVRPRPVVAPGAILWGGGPR